VNGAVDEVGDGPVAVALEPVGAATPEVIVVAATEETGVGVAVEETGVEAAVEETRVEAAVEETTGDDSAADEEGAAAELLDSTAEEDGAALAELVEAGAADEAGREAHSLAAASGTVKATVMPHSLMTQVVAAVWIFETLSGRHWQALSVAPQVVSDLAASSIQGCAQLGIPLSWARAKLARAKTETMVNCILMVIWV
jgi:hypothetical protein